MFNAFEIIERWSQYSKYDPEQTRFNLLSSEYDLHRCNKRIARLTENYDPTGALAVIYAKNTCRSLLQNTQITLLDMLETPEKYQETAEIWKLFNSEDVLAVEDGYLDALDKLLRQVAGRPLLGERDRESEKQSFFSAVDAVVEELDGCNVDLFQRGGEFRSITKFSTHIHIFERLADCLLALERAEDGMYLCYVRCGDTADGYFGFFLKSNGNILSVNERINEAYPGEHKNSRNGRWSDSKKYKLFPYNYIFSFSDHDYKGYAAKHIIDEEKLAFFNLTPEVYMPLVLAMVMLNIRYANTSTAEMQIKYVDSMLAINLPLLEAGTEALAVINSSAIVQSHKKLEIQMTSEDVLSATPAEKFDERDRASENYVGRCEFPTKQNIFVDLYGEGFHLDAAHFLEANKHLKRLSTGNLCPDKTPNPEFVGTKAKMEMLAYADARTQLAEYIRDRMLEEYKSFGGVDAVEKWFKDAVRKHKEDVIQLCVQKYLDVKKGTEQNVNARNVRDGSGNPLRFISFEEDCKGSSGAMIQLDQHPFNPIHGYRGRYPDGKYMCCLNPRYFANVFFIFKFNDWREIEEVVGKGSLPKIVQGWKDRRISIGNPLLEATDPVFNIGTPFESFEISRNRRLWTKANWRDFYFQNHSVYSDWMNREPEMETLEKSPNNYGFQFAIGFCNREFKKLLAEHQQNKKD